ncbi:MAG: hypothetical protein RR540_03290, partial [Oscillospiraceae bacterium]
MKLSRLITSSVIICLGAIIGTGGIVYAASGLNPVIYSDSNHTIAQPVNEQAVFSTNQRGETYGSSVNISSCEDWPDLVAAVGDNGIEGYIRTSESMGDKPSSPEEALENQEARIKSGNVTRTINLYGADGITVIDTFTIGYD